MTDNVVSMFKNKGGGPSSPAVSADDVLKDAIGLLTDVIVLGNTKDGRKLFSSSTMALEDSHYLLSRGLHKFNTHIDGAERFETPPKKPSGA